MPPPPQPSSASTSTTVASLQPGARVTLPLWNVHRIVRVASNTPADGRRRLLLHDVDGVVQVDADGRDPAIVHDHLKDEVVADVAPQPIGRNRPVLGPPPTLQRVEHPYAATLDFRGISILIENLRGSTRSGVDPGGKPWSITMRDHYGEIPQAIGADNDPIDVYVGDDLDADEVYIMRTKYPGSKAFDEVKVFLGFPSRAAALQSFRSHYTRPGFLHSAVTWTFEDFQRKLASQDTRGMWAP
jgi:hypothetical protein